MLRKPIEYYRFPMVVVVSEAVHQSSSLEEGICLAVKEKERVYYRCPRDVVVTKEALQ